MGIMAHAPDFAFMHCLVLPMMRKNAALSFEHDISRKIAAPYIG